MLKHKTKKKRTAPSDSATLKTKRPRFNPDQKEIDQAKAEFKKKGGEIVKVEKPDWEAVEDTIYNPYFVNGSY